MPVIIRNLIVNAEVGKAEVKSTPGTGKGNGGQSDRQRILKLEELTDQILQILNDQKER